MAHIGQLKKSIYVRYAKEKYTLAKNMSINVGNMTALSLHGIIISSAIMLCKITGMTLIRIFAMRVSVSGGVSCFARNVNTK